MALSDVQLKKIIKLYNEGQSARQLATSMRLTLGTINGALYRARKAGIEIRVKGVTKAKVSGVKVEAKIPEARMEQTPKEPTIYNLGPGQCRYPTKMSEDNEQLFCAADTIRTYCDKHHKMCHVTDSRSFKVGYIRPFSR